MTLQKAKQNAGLKALEWVKDGMVLGLGTGSSANEYIKALASRVKKENLKIQTVASSYSSMQLAKELGLPLTPMEVISSVDLYVDGADEVDPYLSLIKGRGAAMMQEKILAACSKVFLVVVDSSKLVRTLGTRYPVPIEVAHTAVNSVTSQIRAIGGKAVLRESEGKDGPVITDLGNVVMDAMFGTAPDYRFLSQRLSLIPGLLEHGIFVEFADKVIIGSEHGAEVRDPKVD